MALYILLFLNVEGTYIEVCRLETALPVTNAYEFMKNSQRGLDWVAYFGHYRTLLTQYDLQHLDRTHFAFNEMDCENAVDLIDAWLKILVTAFVTSEYSLGKTRNCLCRVKIKTRVWKIAYLLIKVHVLLLGQGSNLYHISYLLVCLPLIKI